MSSGMDGKSAQIVVGISRTKAVPAARRASPVLRAANTSRTVALHVMRAMTVANAQRLESSCE